MPIAQPFIALPRSWTAADFSSWNPLGFAQIDKNAAIAQFCAMGKRGEKRNDGLRALKIAVDGGISPGMLEIVAKDGTIFRVYADNVVAPKESDAAAVKAWDAEIAKLKAATPKGGKQ